MFRSLFWNIIVSLVVVVELLSHVQLLQLHGLKLARLLCLWDSPGKNAGVGCHFLIQSIFPTQESNPGLLHCRQTLYRLIHQGSPVSSRWCIKCQRMDNQIRSDQSLSRV